MKLKFCNVDEIDPHPLIVLVSSNIVVVLVVVINCPILIKSDVNHYIIYLLYYISVISYICYIIYQLYTSYIVIHKLFIICYKLFFICNKLFIRQFLLLKQCQENILLCRTECHVNDTHQLICNSMFNLTYTNI